MKEFCPLNDLDLQKLIDTSEDVSHVDMNMTSPESVHSKLKSLNSGKAPGPDGLANWILKEYADILASPISTLLNVSYNEQKLTMGWKRANTTHIPEEKPVADIGKHLRPISLTSTLSKIAEDFVVENYIVPAILSVIGSQQFGGIPRSSATLAPIN